MSRMSARSRPRPDRRHPWRRAGPAALAALCAGLLFGQPEPGRADVAGLKADLAALAGKVAELRAVQPVQTDDARRLARFEIRLGRLEEELRRLTGRIEELEHGQRQIRQRIDRLIGDLDVRLGQLEQGIPGDAERTAEAEPGPEVTPRPALAPAPGTAAAETPAGEAQDDPSSAEEGSLGRIPESALLNAPRPAPESTTPPPSSDLSAQEQYDAAMDLLRAGDYAAAARGLELFLELNPDHPLAANAAYWLAESHYVRKNYAEAAAAFARNYRTYGEDAAKAPDNLLKLGMSLHGLGETDKACLSYEELAKEFPNAPAHIQQALARERDKAECI